MNLMWKKIAEELAATHGCHTVIAYGSRARGDGSTESDYDVAGFRESGPRAFDAREFEGEFLDAHIYSEDDVKKDLVEFLRLRQGVVLIEKNNFGTRLLANLKELFEKGPKPTSQDQRQLRMTWIRKMLVRIAAGDVEGHYRRAWLLTSLLEDYFVLRDRWYLGPKESFRWLQENDRATLALYELALEPGAPNVNLKRLAGRVLDE